MCLSMIGSAQDRLRKKVQCRIWSVKIHVMCVVGVLMVHGGPMYQSTGVGAGLAVWIALFGKGDRRMSPAIVLNFSFRYVKNGAEDGQQRRCASE